VRCSYLFKVTWANACLAVCMEIWPGSESIVRPHGLKALCAEATGDGRTPNTGFRPPTFIRACVRWWISPTSATNAMTDFLPTSGLVRTSSKYSTRRPKLHWGGSFVSHSGIPLTQRSIRGGYRARQGAQEIRSQVGRTLEGRQRHSSGRALARLLLYDLADEGEE
jgi:hypothetical protein